MAGASPQRAMITPPEFGTRTPAPNCSGLIRRSYSPISSFSAQTAGALPLGGNGEMFTCGTPLRLGRNRKKLIHEAAGAQVRTVHAHPERRGDYPPGHKAQASCARSSG